MSKLPILIKIELEKIIRKRSALWIPLIILAIAIAAAFFEHSSRLASDDLGTGFQVAVFSIKICLQLLALILLALSSMTLSEEIATGGHHVYGLEADIRWTSRVWSYPKYKDFVIHEIEITNKRFSSLDSLYFGMRYSLYMTIRSGTQGDEKYGSTCGSEREDRTDGGRSAASETARNRTVRVRLTHRGMPASHPRSRADTPSNRPS